MTFLHTDDDIAVNLRYVIEIDGFDTPSANSKVLWRGIRYMRGAEVVSANVLAEDVDRLQL